MTKNIMPLSLVSLLATCQPSYAEVGLSLFGGNSDFVEQLNKISYLPSISEIFSLISNSDFLTELSKINQLPVFDSFNYVDAVAVRGNNGRQEPRKLLTTVQHHTIVDVFLCLSFASLPFVGELRLAALWWGVHRNKPFIRRILCAVLLRFSSLPAALILGRIIKKLLPLEKV